MKLRLRAAVLVALAVGVAPILTAAPVAHADGARERAPRTGDCFDLNARQVAASTLTATPVACRSAHTVWITAVGDVPGTDTLDFADEKFNEASREACHSALRKAAGRNLTALGRSALTTLRFLPSAAQQAAGARWLACGVAVVGGAQLTTTKQPTVPQVSLRPKASLERCLTRTYEATTCTSRHRYQRALDKVVAYKTRPGTSTRDRIATSYCAKTVGKRTRDWAWSWRAFDGQDVYYACFVPK